MTIFFIILIIVVVIMVPIFWYWKNNFEIIKIYKEKSKYVLIIKNSYSKGMWKFIVSNSSSIGVEIKEGIRTEGSTFNKLSLHGGYKSFHNLNIKYEDYLIERNKNI